MKKFLLSMLTAVMAIAFVGCEYDDSELTGRVENLEGRVQTLEQLCQQMNTNITAMQAIINALQTQDAITAVTPITEGGEVIGYTITFVKGDPITIYHGQDGKDGADGADGADGKDGYTPTIGVAQDEDGEYYWTLDGEWLTDKDGNKIATSGKDGADGEDGTTEKGGMPELKIQGGYWYVSYDGGETWERLGRATGYDGQDGKDGATGAKGDAFFENVVVNEQKGYVTFYFNDGTKPIEIPLYKPLFAALNAASDYVAVNGDNLTLTYDVNCDNPTILVISDLTTSIDKSAKKIIVKAPADKNGLDDVETVTLMVSNGSTTVMASVEISVVEKAVTVTPSGVTPDANGFVTLKYTDNNAYYALDGDFSSSKVIIEADGENQTFDGSKATFGDHIRFKIKHVADNVNDLNSPRNGKYTIKGFKTPNSIAIASCAVELSIENCEAYMMYLNISNSVVTAKGNSIVRPATAQDTYLRYDGQTQKDIIQVYADNYTLNLYNNTIKDEKGVGNIMEVYGNYEQFQNNATTMNNSITVEGNTISTVNNNDPLVKIYNDVTYAPVAWPADYEIPQATKTLAKNLKTKNTLSGGSSVVNILCRAEGKSDANIDLFGNE